MNNRLMWGLQLSALEFSLFLADKSTSHFNVLVRTRIFDETTFNMLSNSTFFIKWWDWSCSSSVSCCSEKNKLANYFPVLGDCHSAKRNAFETHPVLLTSFSRCCHLVKRKMGAETSETMPFSNVIQKRQNENKNSKTKGKNPYTL